MNVNYNSMTKILSCKVGWGSAFILLLALASCTFTACGGDEDGHGGSNTAQDNRNANTSTIDRSVRGLEVPHLNSRYDYITHYLSNGKLNYCMEYAPEKYHSHWVAYRYDFSLAQRKVSRTDEWNVEEYYNKDKEHQVAVGYFPGYERGHLIGSAERLSSDEANKQTFKMSNMSPMMSNFNRIYWGTIEDYFRDQVGRKVSSGDTIYIVKGGTIDDAHIKGYCSVSNTLGRSVQMAVPDHYFMAVLSVSKDGSAKAIGFWIEHKDFKIVEGNTAALKQLRHDCAVSIDKLEQLTGIDFFCNLRDNIEDAVERNINISSWPGL